MSQRRTVPSRHTDPFSVTLLPRAGRCHYDFQQNFIHQLKQKHHEEENSHAVYGLLFVSLTAKAQWVVTDPTNLAQGIINAARNIVQTSTTATNMVKNFQETVKIYKQGKEFYDNLRKVKNLVRDARKVQQTILMVGDITDIYVNSFERMLSDPYFTPEELSAIALGYTKLLEESAHLLNDLKTVVNENGLSMNDKERMDIIDRCYNDMLQYRSLVQYYTNKNIGVSYLRAKKQDDLNRVMSLYGSPTERYW